MYATLFLSSALVMLAQPDSLPSARVIDSIVRAQVDSGFVGVVLVAQRENVVLHRAYFPEDGRRVTTSTRFNIASMTKGFTAAAILKLRGANKLALEDSLARFFPEAPPDKRDITVRQLLTHTSGIAGHSAGSGIAARGDAVRAILAQPLESPPATRFVYMDDDYQLLAAIVEVVSRQSWESYVTAALIRPLELKHTGFQGGDWGHRGGDGMTSTSADLLRWVRAVDAGRVVDPRVSAELRKPLVFVRTEPPYEVHYGYGTRVYVRDGRVVEIMHSGSGDKGHTSIARVLENGDVVIVLSTAGQHGSTTWASYVAQQISPRVR